MQLFKPSPYTLANRADGLPGEFGAVLLKPLTLRQGGWRENEVLKPGTIVPAQIVRDWPIQNRLAMQTAGFVRYFLNEDEAAKAGALVVRIAEHPVHAMIEAAQVAEPLAPRAMHKSPAQTKRSITLAQKRAETALAAA